MTRTMTVASTIIFSKITLLCVVCYSILLATMTEMAISMPIHAPTPSSQPNNTKLLESIIKKAVDTSLTIHNSTGDLDCNITSTLLTQKLIELLNNSGIEINKRERRCKPQTGDNLRQLFLAPNNSLRSNCVNVSKVYLPGGKETFVVTTNSSCLTELVVDSECFPFSFNQTSQPAYCSTSTDIENLSHLGEGYFPQFIIGVKCWGCQLDDQECLNSNNWCGYRQHVEKFTLLKRSDECKDGVEVWRPDDKLRKITVGCSCSYLRPFQP